MREIERASVSPLSSLKRITCHCEIYIIYVQLLYCQIDCSQACLTFIVYISVSVHSSSMKNPFPSFFYFTIQFL